MTPATTIVGNLENRVAKAESHLQYLEGQKKTLEDQVAANKQQVIKLEGDSTTFLKAVSLLQVVSEKTRAQSIGRIEDIATQALQEICGNEALRFKVDFENKRNSVSVEFSLWDEELKNYLSLTKAEAGMIRNIVSTVLRLLVIDLYHPKITGPVVLDETGVHVSPEYQPRFGKFLQQYSKLTERQIILVSHQDKVKEFADKTVRLKREGTEAKQDNG